MSADANNNIGAVTEVVPFLRVADMARSADYYVNGLGFTMTKKWIDAGKLRWCWLVKGKAALMLQVFSAKGHHAGLPGEPLGQGVSLVFNCEDALAIYRDLVSRGIDASEPFVGNALWTFSLADPDGYRLEFASPTDVPEETKLSEMSSQP